MKKLCIRYSVIIKNGMFDGEQTDYYIEKEKRV